MRRLFGGAYRAVSRLSSSTATASADLSRAAEATSDPSPLRQALQRAGKDAEKKWNSQQVLGIAAAGVLVGGCGAVGILGQRSSSGTLLSSAAATATEAVRGVRSYWGQVAPAAASTGSITPVSPNLGLSPNFIADAAAKAAPAVVSIAAQPSDRKTAEAGSGFIVSQEGSIVTSLHIVQHALSKRSPPGKPLRNARPVTVGLPDGRTFQGRITAIDRLSGLAMVKIEAQEQALPVVQLGTAETLRVGEWVMALGSPFALHNTVTAGIVSCPRRKATELGLPHSTCAYIQTDVAINSGNSGGPLVDLHGQVVGVAGLTTVAASNLSFAVPVDAVQALLREAETGKRRPSVGLKLLQLTPSTAQRFRQGDARFPPVEQGLLVPAVTTGSPAHQAGLRAGDVIVGCPGCCSKEQLTVEALVGCFADHIGEEVSLQVRRGPGQSLRLAVTPLRAQ